MAGLVPLLNLGKTLGLGHNDILYAPMGIGNSWVAQRALELAVRSWGRSHRVRKRGDVLGGRLQVPATDGAASDGVGGG